MINNAFTNAISPTFVKRDIFQKNIDSILPRPIQNKPVKKTKEDCRILIVDDNPDVGFSLSKRLGKYNTQQIVACLPTDDLSGMLSQKPEIVLVDYSSSLKDKLNSGLTLFSDIKSTNPNAKIIVLSSEEDVRASTYCLKNGAVDFILKEKIDTIPEIEKSVETILQSIKVRRELSLLTTQIKRDKLLMRGYFIFAVLLLMFLIN